MKPLAIVGIVLALLGVVMLAYQGFSYTYTKKTNVVDAGPLQVNAETQHTKTVPIPPIVGGLCLVGGICLVVVGRK